MLTKAILDADDCAEGMRKFTTEVFDTGVALAAYAGMLLWYDWRLALLCMLFPPISYVLADKSSKAAKLFNAVHKAQVSRRRIKPLMQPVQPLPELPPRKAVPIQAEDLSFAYPGEAPLFSGLSFTLRPGQIIGVTGPVACGKSTLGRVFLCESPYGGISASGTGSCGT